MSASNASARRRYVAAISLTSPYEVKATFRDAHVM